MQRASVQPCERSCEIGWQRRIPACKVANRISIYLLIRVVLLILIVVTFSPKGFVVTVYFRFAFFVTKQQCAINNRFLAYYSILVLLYIGVISVPPYPTLPSSDVHLRLVTSNLWQCPVTAAIPHHISSSPAEQHCRPGESEKSAAFCGRRLV